MSGKVVLTLKEAAEYLNVHGDTLRRRAKNGTIPAFKIGTDWRFWRGSIDNGIRRMEREQRRSARRDASQTKSERM